MKVGSSAPWVVIFAAKCLNLQFPTRLINPKSCVRDRDRRHSKLPLRDSGCVHFVSNGI